jgi:threonine dehydratase
MGFTREELDYATEVVRRRVPPTPQYAWPLLGRVAGATVWVKHENQTPTGSFKVRGGLVFVDRLIRERPQVAGVVSATRGNHGQSLAYAGTQAGLRVVIVVPERNSPAKNAAMEGFGAELIVHGRDFQEALEHATKLSEAEGLELVTPFHPDLVLGVATYARELFDAAGPLDVVYVPVGIGSAIAGLIEVRDLLGLDTEVVGVVSANAPAMALSFEAREIVTTPDANTFAGGVALRVPVQESLDILLAGASRVITVSEGKIAEAMRIIIDTVHQLPEPAGALGVAGLLAERDFVAGKTVGTLISGGNADAAEVATVLAGGIPPH